MGTPEIGFGEYYAKNEAVEYSVSVGMPFAPAESPVRFNLYGHNQGTDAMETKKIARIVLQDQRTPDGDLRKLEAYIEDNGELVLEGYDLGDKVEEWWGDADYEYWRRVSRDNVPRVLLELIKDCFHSDSMFAEWLAEKGIPSKFENWI
jgi:hypothetical protein